MSNKKLKPAAGKSVAGKSNSRAKNDLSPREKTKQRAEAEKKAKRIVEEKQREQERREKKSADIRKKRKKQNAKEQKNRIRAGKKEIRSEKKSRFIVVLAKVWEKIKYYTGKDFLTSFNYVRIVIFIIVPIIIFVIGGIMVSRTVTVNVPTSIRNTSYSGRLESEALARDSVFNSQQRQVLTDSVRSSGSRKFSFYINSVIDIDDDFSTSELCFGNPSDNDCVLVATIFDSENNIIYRSLGLEPGKEINRATMFTELSYGMHRVKVSVNAYDKVTNEKIGTRYAEIKLAVGVIENEK